MPARRIADRGAKKLGEVDLDASVVADPSNPVLPTPSVTSASPTSAATGDTVCLSGAPIG